jgi:signal transduction histidine kinase
VFGYLFRIPGWVEGRTPAPWPTAFRLIVIALALATAPLTHPFPGPGARGIVMLAAVGVCAAGFLAWLLGLGNQRAFRAGMVVLGAAGGIMAGLSGFSSGIAIACVVASTAGVALAPRVSLAIIALTVVAFVAAGLASDAALGSLLGYSLMFAGFWAFGLTRHAYVLRAEQAERALEQERRAREAQAQAAALAERARIAREIHDVLAHSLATVSVNLQAAEGLLGALPDSPELTKALECVSRAGAFTRDGLAEARRAVTALRDAGSVSSIEEQLTRLVTQFRESGDASASLRVSGADRAVTAEAGLAVYRTAQEALTNARKHAPGQPVTITLGFEASSVELRAASPLAEGGGSLAAAGGGYGLTGLRERAALAGGTLTAGPAEGQWVVCLRIPT